jgi:hypothetical protein
MDMSYLATSFYLLMAIAAGLYLLLYLLYRRQIISFTDPLNYGVLLLTFYLAGALILPSMHPVNWSYECVVILTVVYVGAGVIFSRRNSPITAPRMGMHRSHQLLFTAALTGLLIANLVINQIFGIMPLLQGTQARADYGSVALPSLVLLSPDLAMVLFLVFLLTETRKVRVLAGIGVTISVISTILGGSKSSIFSILFFLMVADYVQNLKRNASHSSSEVLALTKKIRTLRKSGIVCAIATIIFLPAYLVLIGADRGGGSGSAIAGFATRLFGGFDGLAIIAVRDIDLFSVQGVNISDFYFYPFIKKLSHTPDFQSSGQYLIYLLSGSYDMATTGLNPNSSFSIELLLSNGSLALSIAIIALVAAAMFQLRATLLRRKSLSMLDLILWALVVLAPFSILLDGAYFVIRTYMFLGLYLALNLIVNAIGWLGPGRKTFWLL